MRLRLKKITDWIKGLTFRTGIVLLAFAVLFYLLSFAQFFLPVGVAVKGVLWVVFFGLAKTAQYAGLLVVGKEGLRRIKEYFRRKKGDD